MGKDGAGPPRVSDPRVYVFASKSSPTLFQYTKPHQCPLAAEALSAVGPVAKCTSGHSTATCISGCCAMLFIQQSVGWNTDSTSGAFNFRGTMKNTERNTWLVERHESQELGISYRKSDVRLCAGCKLLDLHCALPVFCAGHPGC